MLLTEQQLYQIRQIIADHHAAFIVNTISPSAVAPDVLQALKDKGLVNVKVNSIEDSYLYGQVLAMMDDPKFRTMSYEDFKRHIQKNPVPLSPIERQAVNFAQHQAGQYCKGLGNRVDMATGQIMIEADAAQRQLLRDTIRDKTAENIAARESVKKLKSELGWATRDWARDWQRIANTEKQNAMQRGVADHYAKRYGGDVRVAKRPMPDACKHCKRLHIGPDGHPRIFKLSDLEANGTNVGRKASDWLPVVGTVHPHCQCQMIRVPEGWGFDEDGSLAPGAEGGVGYPTIEDMQLAMLQENDLQKSYKIQKRIRFQGIPIAIENTVGSVRTWQDGTGGVGQTVMRHAYGYVERTTGADEDEVDVFLGPDPRAQQAYIIHQRNVHTDIYDEDKVMLGFSNERDAMAAYKANYDRPDFIITCSVMDMDAFKRWAQSSAPPPDGLIKSGTGGVRYVIPLEGSKLAKSQAGKLASTAAASGATFEAARGPVSGTGVNYQDAVKPKERTKPVEGLKEELESVGADQEGIEAIRRDKEIYLFNEPQRYVRPIEIPDNFKSDALQAGETKERRETTERFLIQNRGVTQNTAELSKAKNVTPIGGITPGGKLKVAKGVYVDPPSTKAMQTVAEFAQAHGGKVVDHFKDPTLKLLKIPKTQVETLKTFKAQHGLKAPVGVGGYYAMVNLSADEIQKIDDQAKKVPKPKVKPKEEKKEEPKVAPSIPVPAGNTERLGDIQVISENEMEAPKTEAWLMQHGREVGAVIGGIPVNATVVGADRYGKAVVRVGDELHRGVEWQSLKPTKAKVDYRPSYAGLPKGALVRPDERQQKLLDQTMQLNVVGKHKATEYTDWLRSNGQEVYLVGGLIRDMYAGTKPGSTATDAEIQDQMKDVDIVSTAQPNLGVAMMKDVAPDVYDSGISYYGMKYGLVLAQGQGIGLDFSSMSTTDDLFTTKMVWDHSMEDDTSRRDFTCNSLYYDPHNKVVIDPTGLGIADAQKRTLRLATTPENSMKNARLHIRFWKFRARGYAGEEETTKYMRKHAIHWFEELKDKPHMVAEHIYKAIAKGGDISKHLDKFRDAMKADGCEDLYKKYVEPLRPAIVGMA